MENAPMPTATMELISTTVSELLNRNATRWPDRPAIVFCDTDYRRTWAEVKAEVDRAAKAFLAAGIRRGDKVAIWSTNIPEWTITQLASARIGAILVTINPEWKQAELDYVFTQSDTNLLVMMSGFDKVSGKHAFRYDYIGMIQELCPALVNQKDNTKLELEKLPEMRQIMVISEDNHPGMRRWKDALEAGSEISDEQLEQAASLVQSEDTAMIQYTSGTTGFPKGVMLSQFSTINNARIATNKMRLTEDDRICGPVPFYHCFGSILFNLGGVVTGATTVAPHGTFNPHKTLEAIHNERATVIYGVPTMFITDLDDPDFDKFDLTSLRTGIMAGAPVDKELFEAVTQKMGAKEMTIAYGLTETSPVTHMTEIDDPLEKRMTTVGRTVEYTEAKIVHPETLEDMGINETGEIWIRGFPIMQGYYKKPEETAKTIVEGGWLRSGDLGEVDEDGFFRIVGRLKEMLIVGGHNVYPAEVEQALHTLLEDKVEMLQVIGVPHPKLQEVVALVAMCRPGETLTLETIKERCDGKLEWPKIPRHLRVVDDFSMAMTVTGKIQKFKLTEWLIDQL